MRNVFGKILLMSFLGGLSVYGADKASEKFSFQGFVSELPDGAYNMRLSFKGGNDSPVRTVSSVPVKNGVFSVEINGADPNAGLTSGTFYTSTGSGDIRVQLEIETAPGNFENFGDIPLTSVGSAWVAKRAIEAGSADTARMAQGLNGITVEFAALPGAGEDGYALKYNHSAGKMQLMPDNTGSGTPMVGQGLQISGATLSVKAGSGLSFDGSNNLVVQISGPGLVNTASGLQLDVGTGAGKIPQLDGAAKLALSAIPTLSMSSITGAVYADGFMGGVTGVVNGAHIADDQITRSKIASADDTSEGLFLMGTTSGSGLVWASIPGTLPPTGGSFQNGDLLVYNNGNFDRVPKGATGEVLAINDSAAYAWVNPDNLGGGPNGGGEDSWRMYNSASRQGASMALAGTSTQVTLQASSPNPVDLNFANGLVGGTVQVFTTQLTANQSPAAWSNGTLPTDETSYLWIDYNSGGGLLFGYTANPPFYQDQTPSGGLSNGDHWYNENTHLMQEWNGSSWVTRNRVFVGYAITVGNEIVRSSYFDPRERGDSHGVYMAENATDYFEVPRGVYDIMFEAWAGGGGGGGGCDSSNRGGGGGASSYGKGMIPTRPGSVLVLKAGLGGGGGTSPGSCGSMVNAPGGTDSLIDDEVVAKGGQGGAQGNVSTNNGGTAGDTSMTSYARIRFKGNDGLSGDSASMYGTGGDSYAGGTGGAGVMSIGPGAQGEGVGSGGSGGMGSGNSGGMGRNGMIILHY